MASGESAFEDLCHHGIIIRALHGADLVMAIVAVAWFAVFKTDQRANRLFAAEIGDIQAFNPVGWPSEVQFLLQGQ